LVRLRGGVYDSLFDSVRKLKKHVDTTYDLSGLRRRWKGKGVRCQIRAGNVRKI
jgi:hypothetical protein